MPRQRGRLADYPQRGALADCLPDLLGTGAHADLLCRPGSGAVAGSSRSAARSLAERPLGFACISSSV
ncbi:MAG: hypothetical protein M3323_16085, partial [Actinomycetota bacterium]|nr:hypothetical protein [Actinomycetota bacterium]